MILTYNALYLEVRKRLRLLGAGQPALEAREIIRAATGKTQEELLRDMQLYPASDTIDMVYSLLKKREDHEPLAYITGEWEFMGLPLAVDRSVLIPRADTEVLAQAAIDYIKPIGPGSRALDLCTGSGCLGIAIAAFCPDVRVVMADISAEALSLARTNVRKHKLGSRVICTEADATQAPPSWIGSLDLIVSNPPYIPTADIASLDRSVREYEPHIALDGGEDGLSFYRPIAAGAAQVLRDGGKLMVECGIGEADKVMDIFYHAGFASIEAIPDTQGIDRVVSGTIFKQTGSSETAVQ